MAPTDATTASGGGGGETILLEAALRVHEPPPAVKNPFRRKSKGPLAAWLERRGAKGQRRPRAPDAATTATTASSGIVQLIARRDPSPSAATTTTATAQPKTSYALRFVNVRVANDRNAQLSVLLSRASVASLDDDAELRNLEAQGELVPLDLGPDGLWAGAHMPTTFEQPLAVFDPLVFASVVVCKPSAARPPTVLPIVVAAGEFKSYLPPEKTPAEIEAELAALAAKLNNTVMELQQDALQDQDLDLDTLQRNARELFRLFDQDRSDSIDFDEYKQMLAYRGINLLEAKARRLFQLVDDQKKGYIDEREFVVALYITNTLRANRKAATQVLSPVDVFHQLDGDRDEQLNAFEYKRAMELLDITAGHSRIHSQFPRGAAAITLEQFKFAWANLVDVEKELKKRGVDLTPGGNEERAKLHSGPHLYAGNDGARLTKRSHEYHRSMLLESINTEEQEELEQAMKAKAEVVRIEKERRDREQEEKRALFAQQRQTETKTRTKEALRERQEKINRRKERVLKERQAREEKRLLNQISEEREKRHGHELQAVQEFMSSKVDRIVEQKARFGDDVLNLASRELKEIPLALMKGRDAISSLTHILILNLSRNRLHTLPGSLFSHLFSLQMLDLSENDIEALPPEIGEARDLTTFDVRSNKLRELPLQIKYLAKLRVLNISHNLLQRFGDALGEHSEQFVSYCVGLSSLEDLNLSNNDTLVAVSESVSQLKSLKVLSLKGSLSLKRLPDGLQNLHNLLRLDVSASEQKRIGKHVLGSSLSNLRHLDLSKNTLSTLPEGIGSLTNLQQLDISNNSLLALPPQVGNLSELVSLIACKNKIENFPDTIGNLTNLETISLTANRLSSIPPFFGLLTSLQAVDLSRNQLCELPMEFGALINVRHLQLAWNELTYLPEELGCLSSIVRVDVSHNRLTALPDSIVLWQSLSVLSCAHNQLETPLTSSIRELQSLRYVDFAENELSRLEPCLYELPAVEVLNLSGNRLTLLPAAMASAPSARSLRKLDLYNNQLRAIPVEWSPLLMQLEVFSVGRNPMELLPEKWSDRWRLEDHYGAGAMRGYSTSQVKEWVHDQRICYPVIAGTWEQLAHKAAAETSSDAFVRLVQSAMESDGVWERRFERVVRHYYYEFKHVGHIRVFEETAPEEEARRAELERRRALQQQQRTDEAIAINEDQRARLEAAYHVHNQDPVGPSTVARRRQHERRLLEKLRAETQELNDVLRDRVAPAEQRHRALVAERKTRFAQEMKAAARQRELARLQARSGIGGRGEDAPRTEQ